MFKTILLATALVSTLGVTAFTAPRLKAEPKPMTCCVDCRCGDNCPCDGSGACCTDGSACCGKVCTTCEDCKCVDCKCSDGACATCEGCKGEEACGTCEGCQSKEGCGGCAGC